MITYRKPWLLLIVLITLPLTGKQNTKLPEEIQDDIIQRYKEISEDDIKEMVEEYKEQPELLKSNSYKTIKAAEKELRQWLKAGIAQVRHQTKELLVIEHFGKADMRNPKIAKSISIWGKNGKKWEWAHGSTGKLWVFDLDKNGTKDLVMLDGCCGNAEIIAVLNPTLENWDKAIRYGWGEMVRPGKEAETYHFKSLMPKACSNFRLNLQGSNSTKKSLKIRFDCKRREFSEASGS